MFDEDSQYIDFVGVIIHFTIGYYTPNCVHSFYMFDQTCGALGVFKCAVLLLSYRMNL